MHKYTERLELVAIDRLVPYDNNARIHTDDQIEKIQASLREFGFVNPVLIGRDYGIIAGHGRVKAAIREGITEVPCVWVDHLTDAQKRAYILADNKLAELAEWDFSLLYAELAEIDDIDMGALGFETHSPDDYGIDFELPDGEKKFEQITFTLSREQADTIRDALRMAKTDNNVETWGNENENGNAIYRVVLEWGALKT